MKSLLTSWEDVEKQFEAIRFSCGHSEQSTAVFERVCELFVDAAYIGMRTPSDSPPINEFQVQVLLGLKKERESWDRNTVCNKFVNIVSELPISGFSQVHIFSPHLCHVHARKAADNKSGNGRVGPCEEISQNCSVVIECSVSPDSLCNSLALLDSLNQNITDLHIRGLNLFESQTNIQQMKVRMDLGAKSCNLDECTFPNRVQNEIGYQLSKCDKLKILNIPSMPCMADEIIPHISNFIFLTGLNLANCNISEELSSNLCDDLQYTPHLKSLDLSCNHLGPKGARNRARSIKRWGNSPKLDRIDLKNCNLDPTGCVSIMETLVSCEELFRIDVSENLLGGFLQALEMHGICPQPVSLRMRATSLFDQDIQALASMIEKGNILKLTEISLGYFKLRDFADDLDANNLDQMFRSESTDTLLAWNTIVVNVPCVFLSEGHSDFCGYEQLVSELVQAELRRRDGSERAEIMLDLLTKYFAGETKDIKDLYFL